LCGDVDNCPFDFNPGQEDVNDNNIGDVCECCIGKVGDANGVGGDDPTIGDIATIIDNKFISGLPLPCLFEADANQSGGINPQPSDITIGDVSTIIDHLFISGTPLADCL